MMPSDQPYQGLMEVATSGGEVLQQREIVYRLKKGREEGRYIWVTNPY